MQTHRSLFGWRGPKYATENPSHKLLALADPDSDPRVRAVKRSRGNKQSPLQPSPWPASDKDSGSTGRAVEKSNQLAVLKRV